MPHFARVAYSKGDELAAVEHAINTAIIAGFFVGVEKVSVSTEPDKNSPNVQLLSLTFTPKQRPKNPPKNFIGEEPVEGPPFDEPCFNPDRKDR